MAGMSAWKCERCGIAPQGDGLHDYCSVCSKNLCDECMAKGHCGNVPAKSGMEADDAPLSERAFAAARARALKRSPPTEVEVRPEDGHPADVSALLLRTLVEAYDAHQRRTGESPEQIAERAGLKRESLLRALRKGRTGEGDAETETIRKIAEAIGLTWKLEQAPEKP